MEIKNEEDINIRAVNNLTVQPLLNLGISEKRQSACVIQKDDRNVTSNVLRSFFKFLESQAA